MKTFKNMQKIKSIIMLLIIIKFKEILKKYSKKAILIKAKT